MHIIAGKHKGRKIDIGKGATHVRPTSGFARQAVFNILSHGAYASDEASPFRGKAVADLCCGSGAFGLEALSRGAARVTFVDMDHNALLAARQNAERMGEVEHASFLRANVSQLPPAREVYSLMFLDPPYFSKLIAPCLHSLITSGWVDAHSLVVVEQDAQEEIMTPATYAQIDERRYGRAWIRLLKPLGNGAGG